MMHFAAFTPRSALLLDGGYSTDDKLCFTPHLAKNSLNAVEFSCGPPSELIAQNTFAVNTVPCKVCLVLKQLFDLYPMVFQQVQQIPSCSIIVWRQCQSYHSNRAPKPLRHCRRAASSHFI